MYLHPVFKIKICLNDKGINPTVDKSVTFVTLLLNACLAVPASPTSVVVSRVTREMV